MANGKTHDLGGLAVGLVVTAFPLIQYAQSPPIDGAFTPRQTAQIVIGVSEIIGTLYLSPDLDGKGWRSECLQRWDQLWLGWIWWVYGNSIQHRHPLSHSPILGTLGRALYLGFFIGLLIKLLPWTSLDTSYQLILSQWELFLSALIGIEISANVHYFLDGLWEKWIKKALGIKKRKHSGRRKSRIFHDGNHSSKRR